MKTVGDAFCDTVQLPKLESLTGELALNLQQSVFLRCNDRRPNVESSMLENIVFGKLVLNPGESVQPPVMESKQEEFQHRQVYTCSDYQLLIKSWMKGINIHLIAEVLDMPIKTARNIIWRFKSTGMFAPQKRGTSHPVKFDKRILSPLIYQYLSDPAHSNSTLVEIQQFIWTKKQILPSVSWIEKLLHSKLFLSKPMTLKYASIEPKSRNSPDVIQHRYEFVCWLNSLSIQQTQSIIFLDEHGYNLYTVKHRAWARQGERATVLTPTVKSQNVTVTIAVSPTFGKIAIQIVPIATTKEIFNLFLSQVHRAWITSKIIPDNLKKIPPILVMDNLRAHSTSPSNASLFNYVHLPKYSPFLNLAEPCNRAHKQNIRKYQREHIEEIIPYLQSLKWGEKSYERCELLRKIGHISWKQIPDTSIHKYWHNIIATYFPHCLHKEPIHA